MTQRSRLVGTVVLAGVIGAGLTACSGDNSSDSTSAPAPGTATTAGGSPTGTGTTSVPGALPGSTVQATGKAVASISGSDQAAVTISSCKATKTGVAIEATVKNTTTGARTFVIAVGVRAGGKDAGGTALLAPNVAANGTAKATGETKTKVSGAPICRVTNVNGIDS